MDQVPNGTRNEARASSSRRSKRRAERARSTVMERTLAEAGRDEGGSGRGGGGRLFSSVCEEHSDGLVVLSFCPRGLFISILCIVTLVVGRCGFLGVGVLIFFFN